MSLVLCKGGMHHVPPQTIVELRNGRLICSACVALIRARMSGQASPQQEHRSQALPNRQFRMLPR